MYYICYIINLNVLLFLDSPKANKWCSNGVDLLASQQIDKFQTAQGAQSALQEIEKFLKTSRELKLSNPKEFRLLFDSLMTADTRVSNFTLRSMEQMMHSSSVSMTYGRWGCLVTSAMTKQT